MKRPKLVRPKRSCRHHLRPRRPKRSRRLGRRFKRRLQGAGLNDQKENFIKTIKISRSAKVEPSYFLQTPNVTSGVANFRCSFKERRTACAFVRNDYIGAHVSLREHMSADLLKRSVLVGSYLLLTEGYVPIPVAREIVSLCFRFWPSVITRQNKPLWLLAKKPPVYLIKTRRPATMDDFHRRALTEMFEVQPRAAINLLSSLSGNSREFEEKAKRFHSNIFEALSDTDGDSGMYSESEYYSDGMGYSDYDLEDHYR